MYLFAIYLLILFLDNLVLNKNTHWHSHMMTMASQETIKKSCCLSWEIGFEYWHYFILHTGIPTHNHRKLEPSRYFPLEYRACVAVVKTSVSFEVWTCVYR